jgi:hypothetical protein
MRWWYLITALILPAIALVSYISGKKLKKDIRKDKLKNISD